MLIATLLAAIVTLLTGGHKSPFITPDLQKKIRKNVKDSDRRARVLAILKTLIAARKRLDDRGKLYKKMLAPLVADRETTREEFTTLFEGLLGDYRQTEERFIDGRLAVLGILSAAEFEACIDRDRRPSDKAWKKLTKSLHTHLAALAKASKKAIDDPSSRGDVLSAIQEFEQDLVGLLKGLVETNYHDDEVLGRYDASREELIANREPVNAMRARLWYAFVDLHQSLAKATTNKQWKAAAKALKAL